MSRLMEFFEDPDNRLSITRLISLGCFLVASAVYTVVAIQGKATEGWTAIYVGAFCLLGANNKWQETRPQIAQAEASAAPTVINQKDVSNDVDNSK